MYKTEIVKNFRKEIHDSIKKSKFLGVILIIIVFFGVGSWSVLARVDQAAIALGEVIASGENKVVQHLEGGIIKEIHVKEGAKVEAGQKLISLSETAAGASAQIVESSLNTALAEYARLVAERDDKKQVEYPQGWDIADDKYKEFIESQNKIFDERRKTYLGKVDILKERSRQLSSQIRGLRSQIESAKTQLTYVNREVGQVETLLAQGNTTMTRLLNLRSRKAEIEGSIGQLRSDVSKTEQAISENKLSIINLKNETLNEVAEKIKEVQAKINEFRERETATTDTLFRTVIVAPISGLVKDMQYKTIGGVIQPGAEILSIVPTGDDLIAEVKISSRDIDIVEPGKKSRIRLSSYSARHVPMLDGELTYISPDIFKDERSQETFYKGKINIDLAKANDYIEKDVKKILYPGMPVEVYITTGARSPLWYLIEPITRTFRRSMREE